MFAYRHGFHAGNRADVFKHCVLTAALLKLTEKEKPFLYVDTHAGAGRYRLDSEWSVKTGEASDGILRLLGKLVSSFRFPPAGTEENAAAFGNADAPRVAALQEADSAAGRVAVLQEAGLPRAVAAYAALCAELCGKSEYPGSPELAARFSRAGDALVLCELHPTEIHVLRKNMTRKVRSAVHGAVHVHERDGFEALNALLPPAGNLPKRGVVLVDPSYELPADYKATADAVCRAAGKWGTGFFLVWYPLVERRRAQLERMKETFAERLSSSLVPKDGTDSFFFEELEWNGGAEASRAESGMHGCGILAVRPPWRFREEAAEITACLRRLFS